MGQFETKLDENNNQEKEITEDIEDLKIDDSCSIDCYNTKILGTVKKNYFRHVLVCTGKLDWQKKIEREEGSFARELIFELNKAVFGEDTLVPMISGCSLNSTTKGNEDEIDVIVFPESIKYIGLKKTRY